MSGRLHGLGVGPGDPELITVKALRLLRAAPVIAYPTLESGDSFARAIVAEYLTPGQREFAIRTPMRRDPAPAQAVYDETAVELGAILDAGADVAVLCEGDPFLYGSFMYLFGRLAQAYPVEVVPGVSSLTACAAALGAPLCARDDVLTVLPALLDADTLRARLEASEAAAIMKLGRHFAKVREVLTDLGLDGNARYIERATLPHQRSLPLGAVDAARVPYFSMILVHRREAAWR